jgi:hypothetical protein
LILVGKGSIKRPEKEISDVNQYFLTMFASSTCCQLGKIQDPVDGKIKKDLQSVQIMIDIPLMLCDKTKGNLTKKEEGFKRNFVFC